MKQTTWQKTVILVNGVPASGKSTVTRTLSHAFGIPSLTLDAIKEPFMAQFPEVDRALNRQLGCAAYEAIWAVIAAAPEKCIWLVDAWFGFQPPGRLQGYLQQAQVGHVLEVWNDVSASQAVARYAARLSCRKAGHPGEEYLPELAKLAATARPLALGPVFCLQQDKAEAEVDRLMSWVRAQLAQSARVPLPSG